MNYIKKYYDVIKRGKITAPQTIWRTLERELDYMRRKDFPFYFDETIGSIPIEFIERFCKHSKGKWIGKPVKLELFQKAKIQLVYGWLDRESGHRRFNEVVDVRGRKCGKSTETAAVQLFSLVGDGEGGAEIYCVANKLDQARIIYNEGCNMRLQSPALARLLKKRRDDIYFPQTFSFIRAIASDKSTMDGLNAHLFCLDEWHELRDRQVYEVMKQSQSAREQPLAWLISTNGFVRAGFFDETYNNALMIANGDMREDTTLPWLYQLDSREEWDNPEMWEKANPGLGVIKRVDALRIEVEKALRTPSRLPTILTKDFNIPAAQAESWLTYDAIHNDTIVDDDYLNNSYAIGGCDLSAVGDLTCATLLIEKPHDANIYVLQMYFLPQSKIDRQETAHAKEAPYQLWADQGYLTISPGAAVDFTQVTEWFVCMVRARNIRPLWICYDAALSGYWVPEMKEYGFDMKKIRQGSYTWTYPMKNMAAAFEEHRVVYQRNPILRWSLSNVGKKSKNQDGIESMQPVKLGTTRRIDGAVSLLNAWVGRVNHLDEYSRYIK